MWLVCVSCSHIPGSCGSIVGICGQAGVGGSSLVFSDLQKQKMLSRVPELPSIILI